MPRNHPPRLALLLAAAVLAVPASAQEARTGGAAGVVIGPGHLQSLQARLDGFAAGLPAEERALWDGLLLRAASVPAATGEVRVVPVLQIGPGGGCDGGPGVDEVAGRVSIVVQGGRTAAPGAGIVVQGGRTPAAPAREGIVVQGGRAPSGIVVQGGRAPSGTRPGTVTGEAPRPNPTGDGTVAIGPKQDDPAPPPQSLGRRIAVFSQQLPAEERGALEWLLTRAAEAPEGRPGVPGGRPGTPGGLASTPAPEGGPGRPATVPAGAIPGGRPGTPGGPTPGISVSLRQALGIDPLAIGPKQDDPAPPPPAQRWMLRY